MKKNIEIGQRFGRLVIVKEVEHHKMPSGRYRRMFLCKCDCGNEVILCNDKYGHQDIVSDLKRDCRKKWDWLESLKNRVAPQNTWKPSVEQMDTLWLYAEQNNYDGAVLTSLYNDLKKLKEGV